MLMTQRETAKLEARVSARNLANRLANLYWLKIRPVFLNLVDQKVVTVNGSILSRLQDQMPDLKVDDRRVSIYRNTGGYTLSWSVKVCEQIQHAESCVYEEASFYVADLTGQRIERLYPTGPELRSDYTVAAIIDARKAHEIAEKAANEARYACHPFGVS